MKATIIYNRKTYSWFVLLSGQNEKTSFSTFDGATSHCIVRGILTSEVEFKSA